MPAFKGMQLLLNLPGCLESSIFPTLRLLSGYPYGAEVCRSIFQTLLSLPRTLDDDLQLAVAIHLRQHSGLQDPVGNLYAPMVNAFSGFSKRMYEVARV